MRRVISGALAPLAAAVLLAPTFAYGFTYTVTGTINWKDPAGGLHPARMVTVKLYNSDGSSVDATGTTDLDGNYTLSFSSISPFGFTENLGITATNPGGLASTDGTAAKAYQVYAPSFSVGTGTNTVGVNMQNTDIYAQAFSLSDALLTGEQFAAAARGAAPAAIPAYFPSDAKPKNPDGSGGPGTYFSGTSMSVLAEDKYDWDVTLHEYGHYLASIDKLDNSPAGDHGFGTSNIAARGKSAGIRLAWGEGLATYLSLAAQAYDPAGGHRPTFAGVGDGTYTDIATDGSTKTLDVDISGNTGTTPQGEGDELATARILWHLASDPITGATGRGHVQVYKDLKAAAAANGGTLQDLSQVNSYYLTTVATSDKQRAAIGAIFQANSVSPVPTAVTGKTFTATDAAPTFAWQRGNNNANDTFRLLIWDDAGLTHRVLDNFLITGDVTSYQLTAAQWALVDAAVGTKWFVITGSDLKDPSNTAYAGIESTGAFWSGAYSFMVAAPAPEPASLALLALGGLGLLTRRGRGHAGRA